MDLRSLATATAQAQAEVDYPRFGDIMTQYGYDWEAYTVTTDDDYILSTFHILGKTGEERTTASDSKGSVLVQHGDGLDAAAWLGAFSLASAVPFQLKLVDEGYDIWMGNNRGTEYSQGHKTLNTTDDDYWRWTWVEMGKYDVISNVKLVKEEANVDKIFYLGYSQGTTQMNYSLSNDDEDEFLSNSIQKIVHLAPCFWQNWAYMPKYYEIDFLNDTLMTF